MGWGFEEPHLYRPYRDVRFSKDKTPYKTAIAGSLSGGGYLQLSATGLGAGRGMWMMMPDEIERYRQAVDAERSGTTLKGLVCWQSWPVGAWLGTAEAKKRVVRFLKNAAPVSDWLDENVGPTTMSGDGRRR